ncbi:MAG: sigma factor regulator FecR [Chitinophagales bacterium]|nr:MAG: sigma factor regulator FecR [Chitinophagales bacterium]
MDKLKRARQILETESKAIANIPIDESLLRAIYLITHCKGKVVTSGMGKAGIIARKVASTFSSTGTPAVFLHPGEAQHGDLGMLGKDDILLLFSNSGKTREVIEMVTLAEKMNGQRLPVITITAHPDSELALLSDVVLKLGAIKEVCSLGVAPTTSTTAMLALGDVLCVLVMEENKFTLEQFAKRHHGGYLGDKLRGYG